MTNDTECKRKYFDEKVYFELFNSEAINENTLGHIKSLVSEYQEQPFLLDNCLERMIKPLCDKILFHAQSDVKCLNYYCDILYTFCNVRGSKTITRFLSHDMATFQTLQNIVLDMKEEYSWQTRYIFLLWSAMMILMPFPLKRLFTEENFKKIVESQRRWFVLSAKERDASILWHANLFSREDAAEEFQEFILFTRENIANEVYSKSIMSVWSILMKKARRERLVEPAKMLLLLVINLETGTDTNWKKIKVKLLQRCGLVLMEPLKNHWRLFNGTRKLLKSEAFEEVKKMEDEEVWVDESVDEIINFLLENVGDKETVIRWSVAKGIARIVYRLPFNMANQILTCLVDIFTFSEPSVYQCHLLHGLCLTFAQLLHRGLVPKIFLDKILIIVCEALGFELNPMIHGMNGQNVRDAAAYACWTASRCFQGHEDVYAKFDGLINKLVCVSLLDREVQVRRACSAAFQEWVGRTASVTNGISLMSIMDYFSVGNRVNSFQTASTEVFQFEEYRIPLIEYAFEKQLFHWDVKTRELMASSLSNWLNIDNKFLINKIEYLIEKAKNCNEMAVFHGCILGLSQIGNLQIEKVFDFVDFIDIFNDSYFVDFSSEIICASFCVLIKNIFEWLPTKSGDSTKSIERYLEFIKKMLERKENLIHEAAADCLSVLIKFVNPHEEFIEMLLKGLEKEDPVKRSAYSIALGGLPLKEINNDSISDKIIDGLLRASLFESAIQFNAEAKRNALNSINKLINEINLNSRKLILKNIVLNLNDYTIDSRGDVGSFVRLEAMQIIINHPSIINPTDSNFYEILNLVIRQSVDKIDKVREKALETLNCLSMLQFDECEFLRLNLCGDWHFNIVQLFTIPKFQYSLLLGLTINAGYFGDMNDDLKILINFIKENASIPWMNILEQILEDHCKKDRIVMPFLNSVEHILSVIKPSVKLVELIQKEMLSKDSKKLQAIARVLCTCIGNIEIKLVLPLIFKFLVHRYPFIRRYTAEQLYLALTTLNGFENEQVEEILLETNWVESIQVCKEAKTELTRLLLE